MQMESWSKLSGGSKCKSNENEMMMKSDLLSHFLISSLLIEILKPHGQLDLI